MEDKLFVNLTIQENNVVPFCNVSMIAKLPRSRIIAGSYLFPALFVGGIIGNVLNLFVLNSHGMRSKTNAFLSAMASSDLCFLICSLPMEMITFDNLIHSHAYMSFFVKSRMTWTALVNWFSAASIWIAVLVTIERVGAIKSPLSAKFWWKTYRIIIILAVIYLLSFLASCYNFVWMTAVIKHICGDVYAYGLQTINGTVSPNLNAYVQFSLVASPFLIVTLPTILLIILNSCLLYYLYNNRNNMAYLTNTSHQQGRGTEFKVACTVSVIVLSFILFTAPSAFLLNYEAIYKSRTESYKEAVIFANLLVMTGKSVNFILYCSSSRHFRRRLVDLVFCRKSRSTRNSKMEHNPRRRSTLTSLIADLPESSHIIMTNMTNWLHHLRRNRRSASTNGYMANDKQQEVNKLIDPYRKPKEYPYHSDRRFTHPIEAPHHQC